MTIIPLPMQGYICKEIILTAEIKMDSIFFSPEERLFYYFLKKHQKGKTEKGLILSDQFEWGEESNQSDLKFIEQEN